MIEIRNLIKRYSGKGPAAVDDLTLTINNGEIVGFAGLNGAGKTTTIRACTGIIYPTSGTILIDGADVVSQKTAASSSVGWVPELPNFEPNAKPMQLLKYYGGFYGMNSEESRTRGMTLLEATGLSGDTNKKLRNYSQGMKKRFSLAASMLNDPRNYFFDETLNGLDPEGIRYVRKLVTELKSRGRAILLSSHILNELETLADRIAIIHRGKLVEVMNREKIDAVMQNGGRLEDHFFSIIGLNV